jgi:hypothetical protein
MTGFRKVKEIALHSKQTIPHGWEWYETTLMISWNAERGVTIIVLDAPTQMKSALRVSLQEHAEGLDMTDPYALLTELIEQMISLYTDSIWSIRNHVCHCESVGVQKIAEEPHR